MTDPPAGREAHSNAGAKPRKNNRLLRPCRDRWDHAWQGVRLPRGSEPAQVQRKIARVLVTVGRILRQRLIENVVQFRRLPVEWWPRIVDDRMHRLDLRLAAERPLPFDQFIEHHPERKDVGTMIQRPRAGLLR